MSYPTFPSPDEIPEVDSTVKKHWGCLPTSEKPIYYSKSGLASKESFEAKTLCQVVFAAAEKASDKPALLVERDVGELSTLKKENGKFIVPPPKPHEEWQTWTYTEMLSDIKILAKALINVGLKPHDAVNIFGFNSPEWSLIMLATVFAGGKSAGIYPTDTPEQLKYKCDHANGSVIAVDGQKNFEKCKKIVAELPYLKAIVAWGKLDSTESLKNQKGEEVKVFCWDDFKKLAKNVSEDELNTRIINQKPSQSCCYVYTSGTTGNPKAVMLSHDNLIFAAYAISYKGLGKVFGASDVQERVVSYLPLCHVAGMMVDIICPIILTAFMPAHFSTFFARTYDLKTGALVERLQSVKPTLFLGVPRVWEKMVDKLRSVTSTLTGFKGHLARWAMARGNSYVRSFMFEEGKEMSEEQPDPSFFYKIADKLVLSKVRAKLGLDCAKICITGAAPIQYETQDFMANFGIVIQEAYGLSETTAAMNWSTPSLFRFGSIGPAFVCTEVKVYGGDRTDINVKQEVPPAEKLFEATTEEQGELCIRGRQVMIGYMANERLGEEHVEEMKKKNASTVDEDGFLHTGDMGCMSKEGFFKITGRYKEIIIGAGGENIAPVPVEDGVKSICPIISNIVMIGDKRKYNVALVTLRLEGATGEYPGSEKLAIGDGDYKYLKTESKTIDEAMKDEKIINEITEKITSNNNNGEVVKLNAAKIQKFMILPRDLSIVTDDFTATLKLKRGFVGDKFSDVVDLMYQSKDAYVPFPMEKFSKYYS